MMKPILFNTEMVRAILEGRKTVTRRLIKPKSKNACGFYVTFKLSDDRFRDAWKKECTGVYDYDENEEMFENPQTPPYQVGDLLYVRETWHKYTKRVGEGEACRLEEFYGYRASVANSEDADEPWKPSIHMPKEAARIWLKVTDVRVERLQDITNEQTKREGIKITEAVYLGYADGKEKFSKLWDSTIKRKDLDRHGWEANPWVWVIEFERCEKPEEG